MAWRRPRPQHQPLPASRPNKSCYSHRHVWVTPPETHSLCASNALGELILPPSTPRPPSGTFVFFRGPAAIPGCVPGWGTLWRARGQFISTLNIPAPWGPAPNPARTKKGFQDLLLPFIPLQTTFFLVETWRAQTSAVKRQSCSYAGGKRSKTRRRTERSWKQEPRRETGAAGRRQLAPGTAPAAPWTHSDGQRREPWLALWSRIIIIRALQVWVSFHWNKLLESMMNINIVGTRGKAVNCSRMKYLHLIMSNYIEFESFSDACYLKLRLSAIPCLNKAAFVARCGFAL